MTKLLWDQVSKRFYEAGLDRGVLYLADGRGVAWSGLTSVEEDFGGEATSPVFFDGVKVRDNPSTGDYSATLTALTYPDEFLEYEGGGALGNGLYVDDQPAKTFGLSYRTRVGNDVQNLDLGYKIHILYNLTATPESIGNETLTDSPNPNSFGWKLSSVPQEAVGYRPTAHVMFDSRYIWSDLREGLESILYGGDNADARLPSINELLDFVKAWGPQFIVPNSISGLAQLVDGMGDLTPSTTTGVYVALPNTRLVETEIPGINQLGS